MNTPKHFKNRPAKDERLYHTWKTMKNTCHVIANSTSSTFKMKNYILIIIVIYFCLMTVVSCSKKTLKPKHSYVSTWTENNG